MENNCIVEPTTANIQRAAELLRAGKLIGMPTETVYGLAANALDASAVAAVFQAKGRPATNPLVVHIASSDRLADVCDLALLESMRGSIEKLAGFWPGPLTLVLPKSASIPPIVTAGRPTVAVRVPFHPVALALLQCCDLPLAAPSANRSNYVSPTSAEHVRQGLADHVALILEGGICERGLESTIVSLVESPPHLLRYGALPAEEIAEALQVPLDELLRPEATSGRQVGDGDQAPGLSPEHYAPLTPLLFLSEYDWSNPPPQIGLIAFRTLAEDSRRFAVIEQVSDSNDVYEIGQRLFAALWRLDQLALDLILIDTCEETGLGRAIMDRLRRATFRARVSRTSS